MPCTVGTDKEINQKMEKRETKRMGKVGEAHRKSVTEIKAVV